MSKRKDTHPAGPAELAGKGKAKAPYRSHRNNIPGLSSALGGRKLPNLAPKSTGITSESSHFADGDSLRKRSRIGGESQSPPYSMLQTYPTVGKILPNGAGPHMDNNIQELNGLVGGSNTQPTTDHVEGTEDGTIATTSNPLPGIQNPLYMDTLLSFNFPQAYPPANPHTSPLSYPPTSGLRICAICNARLTAFRDNIMAISDAAIAVRLLEAYFALIDNWHDCYGRGFGSLEG